MRIKNNILYLDRLELYEMIENSNIYYRPALLNIVKNYKTFYIKQYKWLCNTLKYITSKDKKYGDIAWRFIAFRLEE